ncbi:hypothetical protein [Halalkalibacter hemicellulosilyticus]|uniref:Phage replication protein n=1 Tax=Halalkalibacter hemicellulosilyticusJCM 9152 TaxID=1236971 RepID=W4QLT7_9BACI|nr:hypothetical protein [Halalkalibacter hemicellulosilyticus]GAE32862.1 phage replication protein [Halalkalibacter hemicellulosilyticusJCM 9152]
MAIVRTKKQENPFVQVDKYCINDSSISWKAKGILIYILSKTDNWQIRFNDLVKKGKEGRDAVQSGMEELMKAGYVYYYQEREGNGKFKDWVYEVYERPEYNPNLLKGKNVIKLREDKRKKKETKNLDNKGISPKPENPDTDISPKSDFPKSEKPKSEKPKPENPDYSNNNSSNNNSSNNNSSNNHHQEKPKSENHVQEEQQQNIELFKQENPMTDDELLLFNQKIKSMKRTQKESVHNYCSKTLATVREQLAYKTTNPKKNTRKDIMPKCMTDDQNESKEQVQKSVAKEKGGQSDNDKKKSFEALMAERNKRKQQQTS